VIPFVFLLYLALFHPRRARSNWSGILFALAISVVIALPLLLFLRGHPEAETRIGQLADPLIQAQAGNWEPLQKNAIAALKSFTFKGAGDPQWIYNISGRPLLDPLSGLLFYAGLLLTLWRWRDPAYFYSLVWLLVGLAPVLVTGADSSMLHAIAIQPVVFLMQAVALRELTKRIKRRPLGVAAYLLPGLILLLIAGVTIHTYFDRWPNERNVRVAYHTTLVEIARYLDARSEIGTIAMSSIYPGIFHDPYSFDITSHRDDLEIRWFDARFALVFPDKEEVYTIFPALAPLDAALAPYFEPRAQLMERVELRADDLNPWFQVYRWQPAIDRNLLSVSEPVDIGHVVEFVGHKLQSPTIAPGGTVELLTFWRVRDGAPTLVSQELVFFTHLLNPAGQVTGQQDRLDVPAWNWSPGDFFVQLHRFAVDGELSAGFYPLELGVYTRAAGNPRLPVYDPGDPTATTDHILLPPLEIAAP
jgi:hypothetical protein